jgi:hypothetical protein
LKVQLSLDIEIPDSGSSIIDILLPPRFSLGETIAIKTVTRLPSYNDSSEKKHRVNFAEHFVSKSASLKTRTTKLPLSVAVIFINGSQLNKLQAYVSASKITFRTSWDPF